MTPSLAPFSDAICNAVLPYRSDTQFGSAPCSSSHLAPRVAPQCNCVGRHLVHSSASFLAGVYFSIIARQPT